MNEGGDYTLVFKSEVVERNLNPSWTGIRIPYISLCNGDDMRRIKVEIVDNSRDKLMGFFETSYGELVNRRENYPVTEPTGEERTATVAVTSVELIHCPTFLDVSFFFFNSGLFFSPFLLACGCWS
jgi:hypothetical protein